MNDLQARKELLLTKAELQRIRIRHEAGQLRGSLTTRSGLLSMAASGAGKALLLGAVVAFLGRGRVMGMASGALTAMSIAKTVLALVSNFRKS